MGVRSLGALWAIGLLLVACGAPGRSGEVGPPRGAALDPPRVEGAIPPEFLPALEALEREVLAGDDSTARAILQRLLARGARGTTLELARGFERILDGREVARSLRLHLLVQGDPNQAGRFELGLSLVAIGEEPLVLRPGPARLVQRLHLVDEEGGERRSVSDLTLPPLGPWKLEPGRELRIPLGPQSLPPVQGALALRATWELEFLAGEVERAGRLLPVRRLGATPAVHVLLAAHLPPEPVDAGELGRLVRSGRVWRAAALERAVRVPPADYARALGAVAAEHGALNRVALDELVPALRWLAGEGGPAGDGGAWWGWLAELAQSSTRSVEALDMPSWAR